MTDTHDLVNDLLLFGQILVRILVGMLAGAAIGMEREWTQKMAGLRTNTLVALGASGFVALSSVAGAGDPTRIAAQVVSGIGFLGAGVILREGGNVRGLNTAATLWCSAMVGSFAGSGHPSVALGAAGLIVLTNLALRTALKKIRRVRQAMPQADSEIEYSISVTCRSTEEAHVRTLLLHALSQGGLGLRCIESEDLLGSDKVRVMAEIPHGERKDSVLENIIGRLSLEPFVTAVSWEAHAVNSDV